jgi:O-antigen ligase
MQILRYILLILVLCNISGIVLVNFGDALGSQTSYATYGLLVIYYALNKKHQILWPFIFLVLSYHLIAGLQFISDEKYFYVEFLKYFILILCGAELAYRTTLKELYIILMMGATTVLLHAALYSDDYGRYAGFYLDPNSAGFACIIGCALTFGIKDVKWRVLGLFYFTFCGALTFSRTFFLLWIILTIISVFHNRKNIKIPLLGFASALLLVSLATDFKLNSERLSIIDNLLNRGSVNSSINDDSRLETWAQYYDKTFDSMFFGNGYQTYMGGDIARVGVHNNYLRILGEAGLLPFFLFLGIHIYLVLKSYKTFRDKLFQFLIAIALFILHLTNHNFDTLSHVTFVTLWLYILLTRKDDLSIEENEILLTNKAIKSH